MQVIRQKKKNEEKTGYWHLQNQLTQNKSEFRNNYNQCTLSKCFS